MIKRLLFIVIGIASICIVVILGFKAQTDQTFILWFGLASAILAPIGLASIGYAFSSHERQTLERLSKVPEIEKLISEAQSKEERIRLLEEERENLVRIIEIEARKQTLDARKTSLEEDGVRIVKELEAIDEELVGLEEVIKPSLAKEEIARLYERIRSRIDGDVVIRLGSQFIVLDREWFYLLPYGRFLYSAWNLSEEFSAKLAKQLTRERA